MPIIRIDYDDDKLSKEEVTQLGNAAKQIVSKNTDIKDVFVYANSSQVKINIAPIEIFIEMSSHILKNNDKLISNIKNEISLWKGKEDFNYPVNLTIIPMDWKIEINI